MGEFEKEIDVFKKQHFLREVNTNSVEGALIKLEKILYSGEPLTFSREYYLSIKEKIENYYFKTRNIAEMTIYTAVGTFSLAQGLAFPDLDISLLGIGNHRYFLFHSAWGLVILKKFYEAWLKNTEGVPQTFMQKAAGTALAGMAVGVGIHLLVDVFQPHAINFPFIGSLIDGTMIDDNLWLLGNSLWAFKISRDLFILCHSQDLSQAKEIVNDNFGDLIKTKGKFSFGG